MADSLEQLRAILADRYILGPEIGRGGMATVYSAEDLRHHRTVALKVLHPELAAAVGSDRFTREIGIAARLSNPHIVPLFDSGEVAGTLFYVMPLLTEGSLRSRLDREKQLPLSEADRVVREVAAALDAAHEAGVIHRDIKPANVMFSGGEAVVADFGVATAIATAEGDMLTATGLAVGTSCYMSPEQGAGMQGVDARSDVFALGCIAYEVLAGSRPFDGPTPQAIQARKMAGDVQGLRVVREAVPRGAEQAIRKALSPTPADRYGTAGDFAAALGAAIQFPTGDAQLAEAARGVTRRPKRRFFTIVGATAAALAIWHFGLGGLPGTVRPAAASFFQKRDRVVVSDFDNQTDDATLGLAVRQALVTDLHQSAHVSVVDYGELGPVFQRMQVADTTRLTPETALEVARREGYPAVIGGSVAPLGEGYLMTAEIVEASTGEAVVRVRETADDNRDVLDTVERLSRLLRRHLGESLTSLGRSRPLPEVTTTSLEALELYAQALERIRQGDPDESMPLLERAVSIDTGFASAYRAIAIHHGNYGQMVQAQAAFGKAYALSDRMPDRERYLTGGSYHAQNGNSDSAAYNLELLLELEPEHSAAINNLGDLYETMGRYDEALEMYRRSMGIDPGNPVHLYNLMSAARTLGLHTTADSALTLATERFPGSMYTLVGEALNAYYRGDFHAAEAGARLVAQTYPGFPAGNAQRFLASVAVSRGQIRHAMTLADSSAGSYAAAGAAFMIATSLSNKTVSAWVGGQAEAVVPELDRLLKSPAVGGSRWEHAKLAFVALGYAAAGRHEQARALLPQLDSLAQSGQTFPIEEDVRAMLSLADGDPEGALAHVQRAQARDYGIRARPGATGRRRRVCRSRQMGRCGGGLRATDQFLPGQLA